MKYICKSCGKVCSAASFEKIVSYKKLCSVCLSKHNREFMRREKKK